MAKAHGSIFAHWVNDLWKETLARYVVLIGIAGNVVTFLFPGLRSNALRLIAGGLLVAGFLWANFRVYGKIRTALFEANAALDKEAADKRKTTLTFSLSVVGDPPSPQFIRLIGNQPIIASKLEYLLSDEVCIATSVFHWKGQRLNIPIDDKQALKLWSTRRPNRNTYDGSAPAKLRITLAVEDNVSSYILPVRMEACLEGSTMYRKIIGSQDFRWIL
jgi:hypothetical protein